MRKIWYLIPFILYMAVVVQAKKYVYDSYDQYSIGVVVDDTTISTITGDDSVLYYHLKDAGMTVTLIDTSKLDCTNYSGATAWTTLDLAIITELSPCPTVDTSKGIGDLPVMIMEDSLWDDFGFDVDELQSASVDSIYILTVTDSATSVFSEGKIKVFDSSVTVHYDSANGFTIANILAMDKDSTTNTVAVAIDTLNGQRRILWGLTDFSELIKDTENSGTTLFNRCIGRLYEAAADTRLHVGAIWDDDWVAAQAFDIRDIYVFKNFFELNMHEFHFADDEANGANDSLNSTTPWSQMNLIFSGFFDKADGQTANTEILDSLTAISDRNDIGWHCGDGYVFRDFCAGDTAVTWDAEVKFYSFGYDDPVDSLYGGVVLESCGHEIHNKLNWYMAALGNSNEDTLIWYDTLSEGDSTDAVDYAFHYSYYGTDYSSHESVPEVANEVVRLAYAQVRGATEGGEEGLVFTRTDRSWVYFPIGRAWDWTDAVWDMYINSIVWATENRLMQPDCTAIAGGGTDSVTVTWEDNSDNETGFYVKLRRGDGTSFNSYAASANTESYGISGLWPPNSKWRADVTAYDADYEAWNVHYLANRNMTMPRSFAHAAVPPTPIVSPLSDTSFTVSLLGYETKYFFEDSTEISDWTQQVGTWEVPQPDQYLDLTSDAGDNEITLSYSGTENDMDFSFYFHFDDSSLLATPWIKFYPFFQKDTLNFHAYIDSAEIDFRAHKYRGTSDPPMSLPWVSNGNCESDSGIPRYGTSFPVSWRATRGTLDSSSAQAHGGTYSCKFTGDGAGTASKYMYSPGVYGSNDFPGHIATDDWYDFNVWVYIPGGNSQITSLAVYEVTGSDTYTLGSTSTTGSWVNIRDTLQIESGFTDIRIQSDYSGATSESFYVDDLSISRVYWTFIDTIWTADYKWHKVNFHRKIGGTGGNDTTSIDWYMFLDDDSLGSYTTDFDHTWNTDSIKIETNIDRMWFDNIYVRGLTPSGNHDSTEYAIQDSMSGLYVHRLLGDTLDTLRTTEDWNTYYEWGSSSGFTVEVGSQEDSAYFRVKARSGYY